jgi:hypothetical protein
LNISNDGRIGHCQFVVGHMLLIKAAPRLRHAPVKFCKEGIKISLSYLFYPFFQSQFCAANPLRVTGLGAGCCVPAAATQRGTLETSSADQSNFGQAFIKRKSAADETERAKVAF